MCEMLMTYRMDTRKKNSQLKTDEDYYAGVTVVNPSQITQERKT